MTKADPNWSGARAREAGQVLARVRKAGGGRRLQQVHFYPELVKLRAKGWTIKEIVKYLGAAGGPKTDRAYNLILFQGAAKWGPKSLEKPLAPDVAEMTKWSIDAFEAFFLAFSPHDYFPKHARSWVSAFLRERNLLLNVPPGHAKSEFFMIWVPLWLICRDRNVQILMVSNSAEDAATWAMEVAGQLEHNVDLVQAFGRFAPEQQGDQRWQPAKGVFSVHGRDRKVKGAQFTMESRGMTGRVLGRRADYVIVDDPTKQEDAESETERRRTLNHLQQQVFSRAEPEENFQGGRIMVIGQRVHMLDCYGTLEKQEWELGPKLGERVWHTEKYPAVLDWERKITLWPERWPWEEIEVAYARVGGHGPFETMYQQNPVPEGSALVTQEWINACKDWTRGARKGLRLDKDQVLPIVRVVSVDPSPTKWNGIVVGDLMWSKDAFSFAITEVVRMKAGVRELAAEVDRIIDTAKPDYFIFEESGFLNWFRDDPWFVNLKNRVKFIRHHTGVNKNSQEYGVQSLAADFEFQRLSLPYGDETARRMTDMLANEALTYPSGETNDLLMALWFVKFNYQGLRPPIRNLGNHRQGQGPKGGWSFLKGLRESKEAKEKAWRQVMKEQQARTRAAREQEMSEVG